MLYRFSKNEFNLFSDSTLINRTFLALKLKSFINIPLNCRYNIKKKNIARGLETVILQSYGFARVLCIAYDA